MLPSSGSIGVRAQHSSFLDRGVGRRALRSVSWKPFSFSPDNPLIGASTQKHTKTNPAHVWLQEAIIIIHHHDLRATTRLSRGP